MADRYIYIRNWRRFQGHRHRRPPWIKDYTGQLNDPDWYELTYAQRGLLQSLRLLFAIHNAGVEDLGETTLKGLHEDLTRRYLSTNKADSRHFREHLESLNHAGFIEILHTSLLTKDGAQSTEKEKEPSSRKKRTGENPEPLGPDVTDFMERLQARAKR